jgi:hypothetical protein
MDMGEVKIELDELGHDGFVQRYGRFFLVLTNPDDLESFAGFVNTASRDSSEILEGRGKMQDVDIRPLVAAHAGSEGGRVTIGREGADVELASKKVSKLHAVFTLPGGLPSLADTGSKNGTWLNGRILAPNQAVPVDVGDTITFGSVAATLWGIEDLLAAAGDDTR